MRVEVIAMRKGCFWSNMYVPNVHIHYFDRVDPVNRIIKYAAFIVNHKERKAMKHGVLHREGVVIK